MNFKEFQYQITDYLSGNLSPEQKEGFLTYLLENPQYKDEFEAMKQIWEESSQQIPETSAEMDKNFYSFLNSEIEKQTPKESIFKKIEVFLFGSFPKQLVYTLAILTIGFFVGNNVISEQKVEQAKAETKNVRSQLVLTLLDQPSATKRLQAVSEVNKMNDVTETIIKALFTTLNNDASVNVRLSAIEALKNYTDIPLVREGLVASIINQKSPLVQVELADLMVVLQEKGAVKSFKKLLDEEDVNSSVKQKMEESIQRIY